MTTLIAHLEARSSAHHMSRHQTSTGVQSNMTEYDCRRISAVSHSASKESHHVRLEGFWMHSDVDTGTYAFPGGDTCTTVCLHL